MLLFTLLVLYRTTGRAGFPVQTHQYPSQHPKTPLTIVKAYFLTGSLGDDPWMIMRKQCSRLMEEIKPSLLRLDRGEGLRRRRVVLGINPLHTPMIRIPRLRRRHSTTYLFDRLTEGNNYI